MKKIAQLLKTCNSLLPGHIQNLGQSFSKYSPWNISIRIIWKACLKCFTSDYGIRISSSGTQASEFSSHYKSVIP